MDELTMTQEDFDKAIQSAEDKVRTKYAKDLKALETKVAELTPVEKSEKETQLEQRLAELEAKEKRVNINANLLGKGFNIGFADFLKDDADIDAFETLFKKVVEDNGYVPTGHQANNGITKKDWATMNYDERAKLYQSNPDLAKQLIK